MKLSMLAYGIQAAGLIAPFIGIVVLLRKEQSKLTTHLLLTNIGCLIINAGYMLLIASENSREAHMAYKITYLGNSMFYLFFVTFLINYFGVRISTLIKTIWAGFECFVLAMMWMEKLHDMIIKDMQFVLGQGAAGIMQVQLQKGVLYEIRYAMLSMFLLTFLIYTMVRMCRLKEMKERANLGRLAGAEFIVLASLVVTQVCNFEYDVVPFAASASVFFMIVGVIRGEFRIEDVGRSWLFEDMKDAFVLVDMDYGYLDANASAKNFFPELNACLKSQQVSAQLKNLFLSEEDEIEIGESHYVKKVVPIEEGGIVKGYSMLLTDITMQHTLLEEVKVQKEKAEDANRAKSAFMSNMSHEIRTPMNAIVGMTDILLRSDLPDREKEYLFNIKNSGDALLSIINDILDFSKIESGKMEIIEDNYSPMSTLNGLSMIFLNRIAEKPVELIFDIDKEMPAKLYGDGLRIRQIITNIVNNAIKFTDEGFVKLSMKITERDEENILLQFKVTDTGQGIKEEDLPRLIGDFAQVDKKKNKYKEGTGLGLSISKQLVELMGGTIAVQSTYGQGSEFTFTIPQRIVDSKTAAEIKVDSQAIIVAGAMSTGAAQDVLRNLACEYGLSFVEYESGDAQEKKIDYFFTDQANEISDAQLAKIKENGTALCVVQNPMTDVTFDKADVLLNKPLYTMNFCQVINKESTAFTQEAERFFNFTAPDAKVLVVDDNELNLKVAVGLLEPLKMQIDTAANGKEALSKICAKQYDIVFMDHMMPVMDGVEAVEELRKMEGEYFRNLPVIALTANAVSGAKEEFLAAGMNDFVAKPIRVKEICGKLKKWLPENLIHQTEDMTELITAVGQSADETSEELHIEGLDVAEGILNCGSKEMFISLLGDFYKLIEPKTVKIEKCLADGMIRDYTIEVHALKNTARMIGALKLSDDFYRLEQHGNAEDMDSLAAETPAVLELYRSYKPILKDFAANTGEKVDVDTQVVIDVLLKIRDAMDGFDLDTVDEAMEELEGFNLPEDLQDKMETLRAYVADVAMEDVMNLTEEMVKVLEDSHA